MAATLKPTPKQRVEEFAERLRKSDITVMIRTSSGEDIQAACGQLAAEEGGSARAETGSTYHVQTNSSGVVS